MKFFLFAWSNRRGKLIFAPKKQICIFLRVTEISACYVILCKHMSFYAVWFLAHQQVCFYKRQWLTEFLKQDQLKQPSLSIDSIVVVEVLIKKSVTTYVWVYNQ